MAGGLDKPEERKRGRRRQSPSPLLELKPIIRFNFTFYK